MIRSPPARVRHALGHGHRLAAGGLDLGDHGLGHLALRVLAGQPHADVGHHHPGALGGGSQGHGPTDAAAGTGDGHDLAVQKCSHVVMLLSLVVARRSTAVRVRGRVRRRTDRLTVYENLF